MKGPRGETLLYTEWDGYGEGRHGNELYNLTADPSMDVNQYGAGGPANRVIEKAASIRLGRLRHCAGARCREL